MSIEVVDLPLSSDRSKKMMNAISKVVLQFIQNVKFTLTLTTDTNKEVIKVVDIKTGELIRQMPAEDMLAIARSR